ncbi:MAG: ribosome biogenesis GTP-binding protein YihA/YsxC [Halofilum sp. (in: g-proteobacteria)]|nr:ribosome biogenesis GTP-binding protein YihA/YsxC [Halofilum sp. (in: g-proteobacteria)]
MSDGRHFQEAAFAGSVARMAQLPADEGIEIAFAGRSNAGKSSALNALAGQRGLARTSKTPGRTQLINLFDIGPSRRLVDLPGYGYARVDRETRDRWTELLTAYLARRRALRGLVLVVDIRRGLSELDWRLLELVVPRGVEPHLLLTKADKLGRGQAGKMLDRVRAELEQAGVEATLQTFSSTHGRGIDDLRGLLDSWFTPGDGGEVQPGAQ